MADEPFVDTHIHFWDKSVDGLRWAWLEPGFSFRKWTFDPVMDAPRYGPVLSVKVAACGLLGRIEEARACMTRLVALDPAMSCARMRLMYSLFVQEPCLERHLDGLRKAGLPE